MSESRIRFWLSVIISAAIALRLASAFVHGNDVAPLPGIYDQLSYHGLALRLLAGEGFSFGESHWPMTRAGEPTAHWSYLYTAFVGALYWLFGDQPVAVRVVQALLVGLLQPWLTFRIGRRVFGPRVGLVAAAASALYIYFFYYAAALMTEPFYIVAILWTLDAALRLPEQTRSDRWLGAAWPRWLELGLAIGVAALLRQVFLLFVPFLALWLWWTMSREMRGPIGAGGRAREMVKPLLGLSVAGLVTLALILPWTVRNYRVFDTFVFLNTNAGFAFFWGNHPIYGTHFVGVLPPDGPTYQDLVPEELRHLNEAELDRALLGRGLGFIRDDPQRYLLLSMSRLREYVKFWPSPASGRLSNIARVGSFGLALPLILYGLALLFVQRWRHLDRRQRSGVFLLLLFAVVYSMVHLLTWALIRYRLPVDGVLLIFAGLALDDIVGRWNALVPPMRQMTRPVPPERPGPVDTRQRCSADLSVFSLDRANRLHEFSACVEKA